MNAKWSATTGLTAAQSDGEGWTTAVCPDDLGHFLSSWANANSEIELDVRIFCAARNCFIWHMVKLVPQLDTGNDWLVCLIEIERFKNAEQSLIENELRLNDAVAAAKQAHQQIEQLLIRYLHNIPALSFIKDDQGRYLYASKSFCEFFNVDSVQVLNKTDAEWLPAEVARQFMENDRRVRESGLPLQTIERVPKGNRVIHSVVQKFPLRAADHAPCATDLFVGGIAIDVTTQQLAEERAKLLADDLQNLAYVVSHELQEPITTIVSYQNLLSARYRNRLGADADAFIARCTRAALLIQKMVDDLWTYARISKHVDFEHVSPSDTIASAMRALQALMHEVQPQITYGDLPKVYAVPALLTQLFEELLKNAIRHSGRRPCIISISAVVEEDQCTFCVEDNGLGIDPMNRRDIFKLFRRGQGRPDASGTGMGLSMCARIVEHHGGRMWVDSPPSGGSRFFFVLFSPKTNQ